MRNYGPNKATEITKKQINVLFGKAKRGELRIPRFVMEDFYHVADYYGYDCNRSVEDKETLIKHILEEMFAGEDVQERIDNYAKRLDELTSKKRSSKFNRELVK